MSLWVRPTRRRSWWAASAAAGLLAVTVVGVAAGCGGGRWGSGSRSSVAATGRPPRRLPPTPSSSGRHWLFDRAGAIPFSLLLSFSSLVCPLVRDTCVSSPKSRGGCPHPHRRGRGLRGQTPPVQPQKDARVSPLLRPRHGRDKPCRGRAHPCGGGRAADETERLAWGRSQGLAVGRGASVDEGSMVSNGGPPLRTYPTGSPCLGGAARRGRGGGNPH